MNRTASIELIVAGCAMIAVAGAAESQTSFIPDRTTIVSGNGITVRVSRHGRILTSTHGREWSEQSVPCRTFLRGIAFGESNFVAVGGSYIDAPGVILTSNDGTNWIRRSRNNKTNLYGVAYGSGLFVAVGDAGTILTSHDGRCWKERPSGTPVALASIAFGNGRFVAGGECGIVLVSTNALQWTQQSLGNSVYVGKLAFYRGVFVLRNADAMFSSTNGSDWMQHHVSAK